MKYSCTITGIGSDALFFLSDPDTNFVILFNESAPPELAELSILHTAAEITADIAVGDTFALCDKRYQISAIGDEAMHTLKTLGHCTLGFKGGSTPERPGYIMLEGEPFHAEDVVIGKKIEIY